MQSICADESYFEGFPNSLISPENPAKINKCFFFFALVFFALLLGNEVITLIQFPPVSSFSKSYQTTPATSFPPIAWRQPGPQPKPQPRTGIFLQILDRWIPAEIAGSFGVQCCEDARRALVEF